MTVSDLYRWLQERFDDPDMMPFPVPMTKTGGQEIGHGAVTTSIYTMSGEWMLDKSSFPNLRDGSIIIGSDIYSSTLSLGEMTEEEACYLRPVYPKLGGLRLIRV